jgi:hypothetical protein
MFFLRQSTASQEIPLGPFVDSTDGNTAETGLTIANTDIKLLKAGGTSESNKNSGGATHIASGRYYAVLDATDTNTVGALRVSVHVAGALPVWLDCWVLEEAVYDAFYAASAVGYVSGALVALNSDYYHADIQFTRDQANTQDEWSVTWFKNGVRQTTGITSPTLQLVKRADGTDLKAATTMTQIGSTGSYRLDLTSTDRVTVGEAVLAIASATIDAGTRTFSRLIGRDSS